MKYFEIRSDLPDDEKLYGVVIYNEKRDEYLVELPEDLEYKDAPILLDKAIIDGTYTLGPRVSHLWIEQRVVPIDRQNIGSILNAAKLDEYNEFELLKHADGRCAQDDFYLKPIPAKAMPIDICSRLAKRIKDYVLLPDLKIIVFFRNGETRLCDLNKLQDKYFWINYLTINENFYYSLHLVTSGYGIAWDEKRFISCEELYSIGKQQDITYDMFKTFIYQRTISTTGVCDALDCSRQNVNDLMKRDKLHSVKDLDNTKMFLKSEIDERMG
ncbi:hypothetical protein [Pseudobutyrivibrio xylanivorans]|uniref:Uncharacterized protein n=1 Tax=Pseudobutyrivibrio xylanivorans TaxID=185007 RepID=A0A5P6VRQ6_PSEXY|nr:hypothetical protein [Pseudobutyrivibrio xylanivorans]QFJ55385.1 hypothetical protein FXF36_11175 [Pseudobutyrivibrio xylanivorans]